MRVSLGSVVAAAKHGNACGAPVALAALIAYCALASPYIVDGDNAALATLGALGGRFHPPGYPLYVLWLRLWSWLPGDTPARTFAFATAISGALALLALHAACRAWGVRPLAASIAVAIFAAAPLVVRYHSQAEVFALNHLIVALVLWLAALPGPLRGAWRAAALGLVAGLGMANHYTCALLAPVGLLGVVRGIRESRSHIGAAALAAAGFVLGLLPYAYLAIADSPASWGEVSSLDDLLTIVLRREYGGLSSLAPLGTVVPWTTAVWAWLVTMGRSWLWLPAIAAVVVLGLRIWRPQAIERPRSSERATSISSGEPHPTPQPPVETRWGWSMLAASVVLAGPVLATRFNIPPEGLGQYMCERFHMLPALIVAIPVAVVLDALEAPASWPRRPALVAALPVVVFVGLTATTLPRLGHVQSPAMEFGVRNLLRSLPQDAIVYVVPDDLCGGATYLQLARHERPDVAVLCAAMLRLPWYRAQQTRRAVGVPIVPGGLSAALLKSGRAVFVDPQLPGALAAYPHYVYGVVRRVLPAGAPPPSADEVAAINQRLFAAFDLDYAWPAPSDEYHALAHYRYAAAWSTIARGLEAAGDSTGAREAMATAARLTPVE